MKVKRTAGRILKAAAALALILISLAVLLLMLILFRPVREILLDKAVSMAGRYLPGDISVSESRWSSLGSIDLENVSWTAGGDTLAAAGGISLAVDISELFRKDLHFREISLKGASVDVPSITALFDAPAESIFADPSKSETGKKGGFPREGSLRGLPSIAADMIEVEGDSICVAEGVAFYGLRLMCGLDLLAGSDPSVDIEELSLARSSVPFSADSLWFRADLSEPSLEGAGTLSSGDISLLLECGAERDSSFTLSLVPADGLLKASGSFMDISGKAVAGGGRVEKVYLSVDFLTPGTRHLTSVPALAEPLEKIGDLDGARGKLTGEIGISPDVSATADLAIERTAYLDTLHLAGSYSKGHSALEELMLRMPGILVDASGTLKDRSPDLSLSVIIDSLSALKTIMPENGFPEDVSALLMLRAAGGGGNGVIPVSLTGHAAAGGTSLDSINVSLGVPLDKDDEFTADLYLETSGIRIVTDASLSLSDDISIVMYRPAGPDTGTVYLAGEISVRNRDGTITATDLHTEGMFGRISLTAEVDSSLTGDFSIAGSWPAPPPFLIDAVFADSALMERVDSIWRSDGPFEFSLAGAVERGGRNVSAEGSATLPGPGLMYPAAEGYEAISDLGPVIMDIEGAYAAADSGASYRGKIDLGRTAWIDTARVSVSGSAGNVTVEEMRFTLEGLELSGRGGISGEDIAAYFDLILADSTLVRRAERIAGRTLSLSMAATGSLQGRTAAPDIRLDIEGTLESGKISIPRFSGSAERTGSGTSARLTLSDGPDFGPVNFDSVGVSYSQPGPSESPGGQSLRLTAFGKESGILASITIPDSENLTVTADTFAATLSGQSLRSRGPFTVYSLQGGGIRVDGMEMEGTIGSISVDGTASADSADMEAHLRIHIPEKPEFVELAERMWPDSVLINARVEGPSNMKADGRITGISLGDGTEIVMDLDLNADKTDLRAQIGLSAPDRRLVSAAGTIPSPRKIGSLSDGPLLLDIELDRMPVPGNWKAFTEEESRTVGYLSGRVSARGTLSEPQAAMLLDCSFIGGDEIEKYLLYIDGGYASRDLTDTTLVRLMETRNAEGTRAAAEKRTTGLSAGMTLAKSGRSVLTGIIAYPAILSLHPPAFEIPDAESMFLELRSESLKLNDLDPILPPDINLEGRLALALKAEGNVGNPALKGHIHTGDMSIAVGRSLRVSPTIDLSFAGDLERPSVKGEITIERALLRLPDIEQSLHDVHGESILLEEVDSLRAATDTTAVARRDSMPAGQGDTARRLDIDVTITIPNSFRIESERLNLELEGTLRIRQQGDRPVITGELKPRTGRLTFMGRYFEIQRGSVFFYGEDETNPSFDLTLTARVTNYDISINLTGTALEPEIELTSNPVLSESDIMSLLLFGRIMNDLNGSQSNLLQQRTAEILMIYGATKLEGEMKSRLGVDMFNFQQSTRDPNETALTVGKYINSRTMLKYEQGLENTANFLINLEYQLTRRFRIETFIDQKSETGIEINWQNEY